MREPLWVGILGMPNTKAMEGYTDFASEDLDRDCDIYGGSQSKE